MTSPWIEYIVTLLVWGGEISDMYMHMGVKGFLGITKLLEGMEAGQWSQFLQTPTTPPFPP